MHRQCSDIECAPLCTGAGLRSRIRLRPSSIMETGSPPTPRAIARLPQASPPVCSYRAERRAPAALCDFHVRARVLPAAARRAPRAHGAAVPSGHRATPPGGRSAAKPRASAIARTSGDQISWERGRVAPPTPAAQGRLHLRCSGSQSLRRLLRGGRFGGSLRAPLGCGRGKKPHFSNAEEPDHSHPRRSASVGRKKPPRFPVLHDSSAPTAQHRRPSSRRSGRSARRTPSTHPALPWAV